MWLWIKGDTHYQGFVYPGVKAGDIVNESTINLKSRRQP